MTGHMLPRACPHCGRVNEVHDGPGPRDQPKPGDLSVCWSCHAVAFYTDRGMRKPDPAEAERLRQDPDLQSVVAAVKASPTPNEARRRRGRRP